MELNENIALNLYEMDLRKYDPAIARWIGIDPVEHHSLSTYNAFDNNPIFWADPSGADSESGTFFKSNFLNQNGGHWADRLNTITNNNSLQKSGGNSNQNLNSSRTNTNQTLTNSKQKSEKGNSNCCGENGPGTNLSDGSKLVMGVDGTEVIRGSAKTLNKAKRVGQASTLVYAGALEYRNSLSVLEKVGKNKNLSLLRYSGTIGKVGGKLGTAGSALSVGVNTMDYKQGNISGARYTYRMGGTLAPIIIGAEFGGAYGAGAGLLFVGGEALYDVADRFWETVKKNTNFHFSSSNIMKGFGGFR